MVAWLWRSRRLLRTAWNQMAERAYRELGIGFQLIRAFANLAMGVAVLVLPLDLTWSQRIVASIVVVLAAPATVFVEWLAPEERRDLLGNLFLGLVVIALTAAIPNLWFGGAVILTALAVGAIPVESRVVSLSQIVVFSIGLGVVGWVRGVPQWIVPVAALVIVAPSVERYYRHWRLQRAETDRRYDTLVETGGLFFWEVDTGSGEIVSITGNPKRSLGRTADEIVGMNWFDVVSDLEGFDEAVARLDLTDGAGGIFANIDLHHRNGQLVPFRHRVRHDRATGFLQGAAMEISELAMATQLIRHQAEHDDLTGLITRAVLVGELEKSLRDCTAAEPIALLVVDLDRFKEVNDVLGHRVGDQLLAVLARRFDQLPFVEHAARLGGDEFAFVLVGDHARHATERADQLVDVIEELVQIDRLKLSVSGTVGVATAPDDATTADVLLMRADTAMYRAKDARQRVVPFAESHGARVGEQIALSAELEHAIESGQIEVWFQPQVDLASERVVGAEGLARWRHAELGLLSPDRFLPLLSVSGDYQAFTDEVIRQAIDFAARTRREGAPLSVAVNVSAMSFFDHGLVDRVVSMLDAAGVEPAALTFEITESDILEDLSVHGPVFDRLTSLGVQLSIDDFGVGYSSLSRLRNLPVQELKIDRSFVTRMESDPEDLIIVKAIVDLAAVLGHRSIAEGIETAEASVRLREMGCDQAQGYYFGRPMPVEEFLALHGAEAVAPIVVDSASRS